MPDIGASIAAGILAAILSHAPPPYPPYYRPVPPPYVAPSQPRIKPQLSQETDAADRAEEAETKRATLDFCARHPREYFCTRLEAYLQKHPELK
jgi:hypothetical protein